MMRGSLILVGAAVGVALSLVTIQPRLVAGSGAKAASASPHVQLALFRYVFERVRADYVEKPDDRKLIESAINGMLARLDPHSSYMDSKSFRDMQVQTRGEFGGLGRHHGQRHHYAPRRRAGARAHPQPGGRENARPGELEDQTQDHAQGPGQAD